MSDLFGQPEQTTAGLRFVRVAVERGIDGAGRDGATLTYRVGDEGVEVGQRVEVPLGRGNKKESGIVVVVGGDELLDGIPPSKVKAVLKVGSARLPERLVELARWMSEYYVCPLGMVLSSMMPAAVKQSIGLVNRVELEMVGAEEAAAILEGKVTPAVAEAWKAVVGLGLGAPIDARQLATRIGARRRGARAPTAAMAPVRDTRAQVLVLIRSPVSPGGRGGRGRRAVDGTVRA